MKKGLFFCCFLLEFIDQFNFHVCLLPKVNASRFLKTLLKTSKVNYYRLDL
jgi:hypothetical protein